MSYMEMRRGYPVASKGCGWCMHLALDLNEYPCNECNLPVDDALNHSNFEMPPIPYGELIDG